MKLETGINEEPSTIKWEHAKTNTATSKDGTAIGYYQLGHGPAVILLHGSMESAQSHRQLAEALADAFTVIVPDRRGRGLSGSYSKDYCSQKDVEDLDAVLTQTGAQQIFGVSSGAVMCLYAALQLPTIQKVALFEPPLPVNNSLSLDFLGRYDQEITRGDMAAALVTGMLGAQMGPPIFNAMPRWLLKGMTTMMMSSEDKKARAHDVTMRMLAPTLHYDFQLVAESKGALERFRQIRAVVLLLGGEKSPTYLKLALDALEEIFPEAKRIEFLGVGHGASGNTDRGGKPDLVTQTLREFFV